MKHIFTTVILAAVMAAVVPNFLFADAASDSVKAVEKPLSKAPRVIHAHSSLPAKNKAGVGNYLYVEVENLKEFMQTAEQKKDKIILFIDNIPMPGVYAAFENPSDKYLKFLLTRNTEDENSLKAWNLFYRNKWDYIKKVSISIGMEKEGSIPTDVQNFGLILVGKNAIRWLALMMILLVGLFIWLAMKTDIIRDDSQSSRAPFSLARAQLAYWTFIIVFAYCYIWLITGEQAALTGSTLILLSISIGTTAAAKMVEGSQEGMGMIKIQNESSEGFIRDILSDAQGVSIHRFQMFVWTVVLGIIFINSVFVNLAIPQFDDTLLTLMGISNGTYLGLKIPENKAAPAGNAPAKEKEG